MERVKTEIGTLDFKWKSKQLKIVFIKKKRKPKQPQISPKHKSKTVKQGKVGSDSPEGKN